MPYSDDISNLSASNYWSFDGDSVDSIGSLNATDTSVTYPTTPIARDATQSLQSANIEGSRVVVDLDDGAGGLNGAVDRKAVCGFFRVDKIQPYGCSIYSEATTNDPDGFQIIMAFGNSIMFEVFSGTAYNCQIVGTNPIKPNRTYHVYAVFEGSDFSNNIRFYIDGVRQTIENPSPLVINSLTIPARPRTQFMDPDVNTEVGTRPVILNAAVVCNYQHWANFDAAPAAAITDQQIREVLFEKGCLADFTISTDTQANMQSALDAITDNQGDSPCCIEIEAVSGGGDLSLTSDKVFDDLASIHFRYNGTSDTLNIINVNGNQLGNASIGSAPFGGNIVISDRQTLKINVLDIDTGLPISGARVYIEADSGGTLPAGTQIVNDTTDALGNVTATFDYVSDQPIIGYVRKGSSPSYKESLIGGPLRSTPLDITVLMIGDE